MSLLADIHSPADLKRLPTAQLPRLAGEIRQAICEAVSRAGGHLAPNLGVVELTIALHYVFDFAWDRLLFDVGHQCYAHKLLTGRLPLLANLRTGGGMAGFPDPRESPYDLFAVGHAGTAISTAVGLARGDTLNGEGFDPETNPRGRRVVALVGDASIVNGVAMEGLNNAGTLKRQFLIVLNDNGMSISRPQGALAQYFDRLRLSPIYADFKRTAKEILRHVPGGSLLHQAYHRAGEATKAALAGPTWFEHFGLLAVGPIDGHDLPTLIDFLAEARDVPRPLLLHVKTVKGKGFPLAERDASRFHSPPAFRIRVVEPTSPVGKDGEVVGGASAPETSEGAPARAGMVEDDETPGRNTCQVEMAGDGRSFTAAAADALMELMERDARVVACTAAMPDGTGLTRALARFPERTWDTGICESHAMDMMAGLARAGLKPFFFVYCTFFQRAFDQAFQEVALQGLAVRLCLDRAGLVGGDGAVHHGFCDIALLRVLPGTVLMAAIDEPSLRAAFAFMHEYEGGLSAVRYPRDVVSPRLLSRPCPPFELGRARCLTPPLDVLESPEAEPDAAVLAYGTPAIAALEAAESLADEYRVAVYDARFAKPIDTRLLTVLLERHIPIITAEDHSVIGGFGSAVLEAAAELGLSAAGVERVGIPDGWVHQDPRSRQLAQVGLDAPGLARAIRRAVGRERVLPQAERRPTVMTIQRQPAAGGAACPPS